MNDLKKALGLLSAELTRLREKEGQIIEGVVAQARKAETVIQHYADLWVGGWGRQDYNHYRQVQQPNYAHAYNYEFILGNVNTSCSIDLSQLDNKLRENLKAYVNFKTKIVTELSVIQGEEKFAAEIKLLEKLEHHKWAIHFNDILRGLMPQKMMIEDLDQLSQGGLSTPPHLQVSAHIMSMFTVAKYVKDFDELAARLLRQLEIRTGYRPGADESADYAHKVLKNIFSNFKDFYLQLKDRHNHRPTIEIQDEYDVQDVLHAILRLHFKDVIAEDVVPHFAGATSRTDFVLREEAIIIEVKKTRTGLSDKSLGAELLVDIGRYSNNDGYNTLYIFVFDPDNFVKNPYALKKDLAKRSTLELKVEVFIVS